MTGCVKMKYIDFEEHALSRMELPSPRVGRGWGGDYYLKIKKLRTQPLPLP